MFLRKKLNKSGSISIQIVDKSKGYYRVVKTLGCSSDSDEVEMLVHQGRTFLKTRNQPHLFSMKTESELGIESFCRSLSNANVHTIGPELIFGKLFDQIGFNVIPDNLFRHLVITRLAYPSSKLKTIDYLERYRGLKLSVQSLYRSLDKLHSQHKEQAEKIAYEYTKNILGKISVVFYDMTTLYFEAEDEDDLRKIGFSKDGKFQNPQIMLGLLVGKEGYPIGYDIFDGNTFEGHTLLPILAQIQKKYGFAKPVVIADAGLLSKENLQTLAEAEYDFIIGARIKNESNTVKTHILKHARKLQDGQTFIIKKPPGLRLVVSYSTKRAKKDAYNREKGINKLRQRVQGGRLTKENINNRGYNKFLQLHGTIIVSIDDDKVEAEKVWDGLKGYVTNTKLSAKSIIENYRHLWQIEKAFRISKTDLRVRPIHHYKKRRIEAHLCIAFVAYTIYKELERLLCKHKAGFSTEKAIELTHNMYELECVIPVAGSPQKFLLKMDREQQILFDILHR